MITHAERGFIGMSPEGGFKESFCLQADPEDVVDAYRLVRLATTSRPLQTARAAQCCCGFREHRLAKKWPVWYFGAAWHTRRRP